MIGISVEDFETLIEVEHLLHSELEKSDYELEDIRWKTWNKYWNLMERICQWRDKFINDTKERGEK